MNILFVCTANQYRSKTAEDFYRSHRPWHEYKSCGTNKYLCNRSGGQYISLPLLAWADKIVCVDKEHKTWIRQQIGIQYNNKIHTLSLKDIYGYMDDELIHQLKIQINFI